MKYQHDSSDEKEPKNSRDTNVLVLIILLAQSGSNPPLPLRRAPAKIWALGSCLGDILALCCTGWKNGSLRCPETETTLREAWRRRWRLFSCTLPVCYTVYLAFLYIQVEKLESRQACFECLASGCCLLTCFDRCKDCGSSGNRPADCAPYGLTTDCGTLHKFQASCPAQISILPFVQGKSYVWLSHCFPWFFRSSHSNRSHWRRCATTQNRGNVTWSFFSSGRGLNRGA
jgi:hypothetical protein